MAADWIKMRSDLYRDPKVSVIADELLSAGSALARFVNQHCQRDMTVTRNVMRNVTVGALVSVWGVMRQRGKRIEDNLVCDGVTVAVLDDIADLPGFGEAMSSAGWVKQTESGIEFPHFFEEYNADPSEKSKSAAAERQRRYRERNKPEADPKSDGERDVTRDVTVTHREEKSREESSSLRSEEKKPRKARPPVVTVAMLLDVGFTACEAAEFIDHKERMKAPLTDRAWRDHCREAAAAGWTPLQAAEKVMAKSWKGFEAKYVANERPPSQASPTGETAYQRNRRERVAEMTGGLASAKPPGTVRSPFEVFDATFLAIESNPD